jgi:hypothetical protein
MFLKILKKILHTGFSVFLFWQTVMLVDRILTDQPSNISARFLDSVFINLFVTGFFTIVYAFPAYRLFPDKYYRISNPGLLKSFCKIIRIDLFKALLLHTIWRKKQNRKYYFNGLRTGFENFERTTKEGEFAHSLGFCIVMILTIIIGLKTEVLFALMILFINVLFNFYPFILQRFHRMRLEELKKNSN